MPLRSFLFGIGALATFWATGACADDILSLRSGETPQVIFDWAKDRCDIDDTPDEALRAFRDAQGTLHVFATHDVSRALVGPNFAHLTHPCSVVYAGGHEDDPARFNDWQWLTSFTTTDGRHITALVHNEFHGNLRPWLCKSGQLRSCWGNVITIATSDDSGVTFHQPPPPANLVASPPFTYQGDVGHPIGYFQPTNIVHWKGYDYFMFLATEFGTQGQGICVARTNNIADPKSWRAWNGTEFGNAFVNPYTDNVGNPAAHTCTPVGLHKLYSLGSLSYDETAGQFVIITFLRHKNGRAERPAGVYVSTSPDLINWSDPTLLANEDALGLGDDLNRYNYGFFSLVDQASTSLDYSTISSRPSLSLFYVKFDTHNAPLGRVLVRRDVVLERR